MFRWRASQKHDDENDREAKVKELRVALGTLSDRNAKFCTEATLKRYLEARSWNVDKAKKMLEGTLKWRSTYKPEEIRWDEVAHEGETGKISRASFPDCEGRSVLIMRPAKQNTTSPEGNIRHLVYMLENAILNLPEGQEQMCWLVDYTGFSMSSNISVKTARDIINILQNHYPERLAVAFLYNAPRIFQAFYEVVKYFLDPKTCQKFKFAYPKEKESTELLKSYFDLENMSKEFGENNMLEYNHEEFSKLMVEDELKAAKFWGFEDKPLHDSTGLATGHSKAGVAPEPL